MTFKTCQTKPKIALFDWHNNPIQNRIAARCGFFDHPVTASMHIPNRSTVFMGVRCRAIQIVVANKVPELRFAHSFRYAKRRKCLISEWGVFITHKAPAKTVVAVHPFWHIKAVGMLPTLDDSRGLQQHFRSPWRGLRTLARLRRGSCPPKPYRHHALHCQRCASKRKRFRLLDLPIHVPTLLQSR